MFKLKKLQFVLIYLLLLHIVFSQDPFRIDVYKFKKTPTTYGNHLVISYNFDVDKEFLNKLITTNKTIYVIEISSGDSVFFKSKKEFKFTELINSKKLFDIIYVNLSPLKFEIKFSIQKENSLGNLNELYELNQILDLSENFEGNQYYVSDILLADEIDNFRENSDPLIYKFSDLYINPTVNNNYTIGINNGMFVYFEVFDPKPTDLNALISYAIYRENGELVNQVETNQAINYSANRLYKFYNVAAKLGAGTFIIKVEISYGNLIKYIEKKFTVSLSNQKISFLKYQIQIEKQIAQYLLNETGKKLLKTLSTGQVVDFINQFWLNKAKIEGKTVKELRNQLDEEITYIQKYNPNDKFYIFGDFAAIIIQYGRPIFIEQRTESSSSLPYIEISYNETRRSIDGEQVKYYFSDINRNGRLVLVHSTDKFYLQDPNWQKRLRRMSK